MSTNDSVVDQNSKKANLPEWDLSDLYEGLRDPEIDNDLAHVELSAQKFVAQYQESLKKITGIEFATAIKSYEKLNEELSKISSFAQFWKIRLLIFFLFVPRTENKNIIWTI